MSSDSSKPRNEDWGDDLFALVERRQGKAFISDGISNYAGQDSPVSRQEIVRIAQQTLDIQRELNRDLAKWIRRKRKELERP